MDVAFTILLLTVCALMFLVTRRYKLALLIVGTMCMRLLVLIPSLGITRGAMIIPLCFFVSELSSFKLSEIRQSIVFSLIVISLVALCVAIISSPHVTESLAFFLDTFLSGTVKGCFVLAYSFICVKSLKDIRIALNYSFMALLVLTFFAVLQIVTGRNIAVEMMQLYYTTVSERAMDINATELETGRYAIQSLLPFPAVYGYMCVVAMVFHYFGYRKGLFEKNKMIVSGICCFMGVFLCGRRSTFLCAIIAIMAFFFVANGLKGRVKYFVILFSFFLVLYLSIPSVQDYVGLMLNISSETGAQGSTIEMRLLQYASLFTFVEDNWLLGRGIGFFSIDLGGNATGMDTGLMGLEGVILSLLLERGLVGVIAWLLLYVSILVFALKKSKQDHYTSAFVVSTISAYIFFSNGTGDLGSSYITLLIAGIGVKLLYLSDTKTLLYR